MGPRRPSTFRRFLRRFSSLRRCATDSEDYLNPELFILYENEILIKRCEILSNQARIIKCYGYLYNVAYDVLFLLAKHGERLDQAEKEFANMKNKEGAMVICKTYLDRYYGCAKEEAIKKRRFKELRKFVADTLQRAVQRGVRLSDRILFPPDSCEEGLGKTQLKERLNMLRDKNEILEDKAEDLHLKFKYWVDVHDGLQKSIQRQWYRENIPKGKQPGTHYFEDETTAELELEIEEKWAPRIIPRFTFCSGCVSIVEAIVNKNIPNKNKANEIAQHPCPVRHGRSPKEDQPRCLSRAPPHPLLSFSGFEQDISLLPPLLPSPEEVAMPQMDNACDEPDAVVERAEEVAISPMDNTHNKMEEIQPNSIRDSNADNLSHPTKPSEPEPVPTVLVRKLLEQAMKEMELHEQKINDLREEVKKRDLENPRRKDSGISMGRKGSFPFRRKSSDKDGSGGRKEIRSATSAIECFNQLEKLEKKKHSRARG